MLTGANRHVRLLAVGCLLAILGGAAVWWSGSGAQVAPSAQRPRLVVLVVFDQMRGDYLQRWQELFAADGFRRLQQEGAWFQNCHYPYSHTVTAAGHASLLAGCSPDRHGIVGNEWYDRDAGSSVVAVGSERHEQIPPAAPPKDGRRKRPAGSPERLLAPTLGESLKAATADRGKVIGLSLKDRGAVLSAGRRADLCLWMDSETGLMVSSTFYRDRLPDWAAAFNQARPADRWFGKDWERLRPEVNYVRHGSVDDLEGEGLGFKQGRTFPHPTTGGLKEPGRDYYGAMYNSPFGNELLLELAKRAIDAEHLGQDDAPDLLTISFSSNDSVGHTWGPDSQEVLDVTLRSDDIVRDLLAYLDEKVGRGRYVLALTADHGVCPLAEINLAQGKDAGRVNFRLIAAEAESFLSQHYQPNARWFEDATHPPWFYLNRNLLRELKLNQAEVEQVLARWLEKQPGIARAYTRAELMAPCPPREDPRIWKSFHPQRCGDVTVVPRANWSMMMPFAGGTNHGTPYPYDTHVPLMVFGPGIPGGPRTEPVTPQAIAAILAQIAGVPVPASAEAGVPESLLHPSSSSRP